MKEEVVKNGVPPCVLIPTNHNHNDNDNDDDDDDDDDDYVDDVNTVKDYLSCVKACENNPIAAFREAFGYTSDDEDEDDQMGALVMALQKAVLDDDMPKFVTKLNLLFDLYAQPSKMYPNLCKGLILQCICKLGAPTCATALLQGQTCVSVDLNVTCDSFGSSPLHLAALALNYDLVKIFLSHGARTDVTKYAQGKKSLPLSVAVNSLFAPNSPLELEWSPEESIYKLVIALCLPRIKAALATIKLLASRTKGVNDVFILHAREGDVAVMAALLITASEHIMAPSVIQSEDSDIVAGGVAILDIISGRAVLQANDDIFASGVTRALKCTLRLLNIFARAGDAIRSYLSSRLSQASKEEVVKDVASILREAGFGLNDKDIDFIDCESNEIEEATQTRDDIVPCKPSTKFYRRFSTGPYGDRGRKQGYTVKVFNPHWYVPSSPDGRCIGISQLLRFHEIPRKGENYAMQRCMSTSKPNNLLVSLASSIRRGMRRI